MTRRLLASLAMACAIAAGLILMHQTHAVMRDEWDEYASELWEIS